MDVEVTLRIGGATVSPSWDTIERLVASCITKNGHLVQMDRLDGGREYRAHGKYEATFITHDGAEIKVRIEVAP